MSVHRTLKARLALCALAACLLGGAAYVSVWARAGGGALRRCEAAQSTLRDQLRTIIEHKEDVAHDLEACKGDLHNNQQRVNQLANKLDSNKNEMDHLTHEMNKMKNMMKADRDSLDSCKNQHVEATFQNHNLETKLDEKSKLIVKLRDQLYILAKSNEDLNERIKTISLLKSDKAPSAYTKAGSNVNITQQLKTADSDVYVINKSVVEQGSLDSTNATLKSEQAPGHQEIPQGVAPELFVDEHPMDVKNKLNPPNRYENKLEKEGTVDRNKEPPKKGILENDARKQDLDIDLSQNNAEPEANEANANEEDDDDVDDFGYARVEAAEEALINN